MSAYAGVTFDVVMTDPTRRPNWRRGATIVERIIPYANKEDVQSVGLGNWRITVPVTLTNAADLGTLQSAQGTTRRTLTSLFGTTYTSNTMLIQVGDPYEYENETRTVVDLTFVREGS